jgi:hypothetical protein
MTRRCYVCGAEPQDGCRAVDGEMAECPRPSRREAKHAHGITRVSLAKVSGKHLSAAANELTDADRALAADFAGTEPFPLKDQP